MFDLDNLKAQAINRDRIDANMGITRPPSTYPGKLRAGCMGNWGRASMYATKHALYMVFHAKGKVGRRALLAGGKDGGGGAEAARHVGMVSSTGDVCVTCTCCALTPRVARCCSRRPPSPHARRPQAWPFRGDISYVRLLLILELLCFLGVCGVLIYAVLTTSVRNQSCRQGAVSCR